MHSAVSGYANLLCNFILHLRKLTRSDIDAERGLSVLYTMSLTGVVWHNMSEDIDQYLYVKAANRKMKTHYISCSICVASF